MKTTGRGRIALALLALACLLLAACGSDSSDSASGDSTTTAGESTTTTTAGPTEGWAAEEFRRNDWTAVLEAGRSLGRFDSRAWIGEVDVPAAVVAVMGDRMVPPRRQVALARSIPGASLFPVQGDHTVCVTHPHRFGPVLLEAVADVTGRVATRT